MQLSITDGVTERLSLFLEQLGKHLWDSRQRASFAMYVLGLLSALPNKSVEPIAALFAADPTETDAVYQRLLHFFGGRRGPMPTFVTQRLPLRLPNFYVAVQFRRLSSTIHRFPRRALLRWE